MSFTFRIILAVIWYSIQGTLLVHYARKHDGKITGALRNISLMITWLPLLFWVQDADFWLIYRHMPIILLTACLWVTNIFMHYEALRYLSVGTGLTYKRATNVIIALLIWIFFFWESLQWYERWAMALVVWGSFRLHKMNTSSSVHIATSNTKKWTFLMIAWWALMALSRTTFKIYAEHMDNILAAYILEWSIGILMLLWFGIECIRKKYHWKMLVSKDAWYIGLISSFTYAGTIATAIAFKMWWLGITQGLLTMIIPCSALIAFFIFREKLTMKQRWAIGVVIMGIVLMEIG